MFTTFQRHKSFSRELKKGPSQMIDWVLKFKPLIFKNKNARPENFLWYSFSSANTYAIYRKITGNGGSCLIKRTNNLSTLSVINTWAIYREI